MNPVAATLGFYLLSAGVAGVPVGGATSYHDPPSLNLGMLNWSYPEALCARTAVWMAQRGGLLARATVCMANEGGARWKDPDAAMLRRIEGVVTRQRPRQPRSAAPG